MAENLYAEVICKFQEACTLQSISNAVRKFHKMGVLKRTESPFGKKGEVKVTFGLSDDYVNDEKLMNEIYDSVIFYLPYSPMIRLPSMQKSIKRIMLSEIDIFTKL